MQKRKELDVLASCFNRAGIDEYMFVLLARDPVAAYVVDFWAEMRLMNGLNDSSDLQIREARDLAERMREQIDPLRQKLKKGSNPINAGKLIKPLFKWPSNSGAVDLGVPTTGVGTDGQVSGGAGSTGASANSAPVVDEELRKKDEAKKKQGS